MLRRAITCLCLLYSVGSGAQNVDIRYAFYPFGSEIDTSSMSLSYSSPDTSTFLLKSKAWSVVQKLQENSFLAAQLDSLKRDHDTVTFYIYTGKKLKYGNIKWIGLKPEWKSHPTLRSMNLVGSQAEAGSFQYITASVLELLEENGYPLAKISVNNKQIRNDSLDADILLEPGNYIVFEGIEQDSQNIISTEFLSRFLSIRPGDKFQMSKVSNIDEQLKKLPFVGLQKSPEISIISNRATVKLKAKETPSSRFDFIIGVLPNVTAEQRFTISGELTADLKNKFKQGEEIYMHIQQLKPETQRIDFNATYPYLLNLPFGVHGSFALYRNGSLSRDLNSEAGIQYRTDKNLESRIFINYQSSRLIDVDTTVLLASRRLPSSLDVRINNIGFRLTKDNRDYPFNPRKGYFIQASLTAGIKTILPNNQVTSLSNENVNFTTAYDSLDLNVFQSSLMSDLQYFLPIKRLSTIMFANQTGIKWSQSPVFVNEYYRIGGSNILRGFDEESITAQYYSITTIEYRYLLSLNSYFSAFFDYGLTYNAFRESKNFDQPFGFGLGLSFQTTAGIFGINVALGRELGNNIDVRNAKTHFGFISLF